MNIGIKLIPAAALAVALVAPAQAQTFEPRSYQHTAISNGDYATAEARLRKAAQVEPGSPMVMLNLAAIMLRTGRYAEARDMYLKVLDNPDIRLDMASGNIAMAHDIAQRGLALVQMSQNR